MKGGARRKSIGSELPPPPHPDQNEINEQGNDQIDNDEQPREQEQQQQPPMNGVGDGGDEHDEQDGDDYQDEEEQSGEVDVNEAAADGGEEQPQLAEGFYVIEAVRKKRTRKGETQYLIKWRGWPDSANTWEPIENLSSCPEFIDAFEDSLRSGKQRSSRKRKRKQLATPKPQSKKKSKQASPADTYKVPSVKINIIEEPLPTPSVHNSNFSNGTETNLPIDIISPQLDVEPNEPKAPSSTNQENASEFAIHIQENGATEGVEIKSSKADASEGIRVSPRFGSRRRKSCAVKRFKQDSNLLPKNDEIRNVGPVANGLGSSNVVDTPAITKIVKPVNYSTTTLNDIESVLVSFLVKRSDGEEVIVDNNYLKENNPILLINFYEQHLRYTSPSE